MSRIKKFFSQRATSLTEFPLWHVLLGFLTTLAIVNVHIDYDKLLEAELIRLALATIFALPLTLLPGIIQLINKKTKQIYGNFNNESKDVQKTKCPSTLQKTLWISLSFLWQIVGLLAGIIFYILLPNDIQNIANSSRIWIIGNIILAFLLVFFSIVRMKKNNEMFTWTRRKGVIESVIIGWIAWLVIWWGISACIKSIEFLFNVEFSSENIYGYIASVSLIFIAWSIALLNFINQENELPVYTRTYRIFWQYIFLPLTVIYWLILLSYGVKILITGVRPTWTIIYMVIWYVTFGLLTRLTTYPALPNSFISKSHFVLFVSFLLTSLLMIPAIGIRIEQYGLTIDRYFVCVIIIRIMLFSIGSCLFKNHRIVIITSLLIALWSFALYWWEWNAKNMSVNDQKSRLITMIQEYRTPLPLTSWSLENLSKEQQNDILRPLEYLITTVDTMQVERILSQKDLFAIETARWSYEKKWILCKALGLSSCPLSAYEDSNKIDFNFSTKGRPESMSISGYSMLYNFNCESWKNSVRVGNILFDFTPYMSGIYLHAIKNQNNYMQPEKATIASPQNNTEYIIENDNTKIVLYEIGGRQTQNKDKTSSYSIEYCDGVALVK